ncbi:hypothetical protein MHYP_G00024880 [Metynnis hypsauchen]
MNAISSSVSVGSNIRLGKLMGSEEGVFRALNVCLTYSEPINKYQSHYVQPVCQCLAPCASREQLSRSEQSSCQLYTMNHVQRKR